MQPASLRAAAPLCLSVLIVLGAVAVAGDLNPPFGPVLPTMKTIQQAEPRIPIDTLPFTISQPGSYYLTGDLTPLSSGSNGVEINSDHVTLDLNGFAIHGPQRRPDRFGAERRRAKRRHQRFSGPRSRRSWCLQQPI